MNVFISKANNYCVANKAVILTTLLVINILLLAATQMQQSHWMGTIETPKAHWSTYIQQHADQLAISRTYSNSGTVSPSESGAFFNFTYQPLINNEFIMYNPDMSIKFYRLRAYNLDDKCRLIFRGRKTQKLYNVNMTCKM